MRLLYRPATPDDVDLAVPLLFLSSPASIRYVFSVTHRDQALSYLIYAYTQGGGEFGFDNHTMVEAAGRELAIGGMWDSTTNRRFFADAARKITAFYGLLTGIKVMIRGMRIERVIWPPHRHGVSYIGNLAVRPLYQNNGIGSQMLDYFVDKSRALGYERASLDVAAGNLARGLYERKGFVLKETRKSGLRGEYGAVADHHYMEMGL